MDYTKYYSINSRIKKFYVFIFLFTTCSLWAQQNANLPYSSNGIGILNADNRFVFNSLGNTLVSSVDSTMLNIYNPSSYSGIGKGQPIFSIGLDNTLNFSNVNGIKEKGAYTQINHFAFGVSFAKIVGFAFGIKPFTHSSYSFSETVALDEKQNMRHLYNGGGNSSLFFGGLSVNALNFKHHKLGLGANLGYVFGSTVNAQSAYIEKDASVNGGVMYSTTRFLKAINYDFGLNYQYIINDDRIILGFTYTPKQQLRATHVYEKAFSTDLEDQDNYNYISSTAVDGKITTPSSMAIGLQYVLNTRKKNQNAKLNSRIIFSAEYRNNLWSEYGENFAGQNTPNYNYANTTTYSFGVEYTPQQLFLERVTTGYMSKVRYRVGASFGQLPYTVQGNQMDRNSYVVGFGFPFSILRSSASVNFSAGYATQNVRSMAYKEQFVQFSLGINFTPGINDRWFRKYKID